MANNVKPRGRGYQANLMLDGKRYRPTFNTEEEAITWVSDARLAHRLGKPIPQPTTNITKGGGRITTMGQLYEITVRDKWGPLKSGKELARNGRLFVSWVGSNTPIRDVTSATLYDYMEFRRTTLSNGDATLNRHLSAAKVMLTKAKHMDIITVVPYVKKLNERSRGSASDYFDFGEEDAILTHLQHLGYDQLYDMVVFMVDTGARIAEVLRLTFRQIGTKAVRFEQTKNGSFRTIPLTKRARAALERRRLHSPDALQPFGGIKSDWARSKLKLTYAHLGGRYENISQPFHIFRHSCASRLAIKGVDANRIKEWMDHSSLQTTERYMKLSPRALDEVVDVLEQEHDTNLRVIRE